MCIMSCGARDQKGWTAVAMDDIDAIVASVCRDMGIDRTRPPQWMPDIYTTGAGFQVTRGFTCSFCGKHSWVKRKVCDGCKSEMQ